MDFVSSEITGVIQHQKMKLARCLNSGGIFSKSLALLPPGSVYRESHLPLAPAAPPPSPQSGASDPASSYLMEPPSSLQEGPPVCCPGGRGTKGELLGEGRKTAIHFMSHKNEACEHNPDSNYISHHKVIRVTNS